MARPQCWLVTDPTAEAGSLETLPPTDGLHVLTVDELRVSDLEFARETKVAITTEAAMDEVVERLDPGRRRAVEALKDKETFRRTLAPLFPDLEFHAVAASELVDVELDPKQRYVVKPARGVFGVGVRTIEGSVDLERIAHEIGEEIASSAGLLSDKALSGDRMLIERYIAGEEYAVDMFFDSDGAPVLVGAYHHPMPDNAAYLHMVYYSSREVWDTVTAQALAFFRSLNETLEAANLALHAEFRLERGRLVPIEINSMRFGGMGLGNLLFHTEGLNAYRHFVDDTHPAGTLFEDDPRPAVFFIAYNGATIDPSATSPSWPRLREHFSAMVKEVPFDHRKQLAFGVIYAREPVERLASLLAIEFDELFEPDPS